MLVNQLTKDETSLPSLTAPREEKNKDFSWCLRKRARVTRAWEVLCFGAREKNDKFVGFIMAVEWARKFWGIVSRGTSSVMLDE